MIEKLKRFSPLILTLIIIAFVYFPSCRFDFVNWDDHRFILDNPMQLTIQNVIYYFSNVCCDLYTPLLFISYMFDHALFGLEPVAFHAHNLLLFLGATVVLWFILKKLEIQQWIAAACILLFALSIQRVESVVWIAERKDMLCLFFGLLSFYAFMRDYDRRRPSFLTALFFLLSMMGKPAGLGLISAYCVYAFYRSAEIKKIQWKVFIPFLFSFIIYSLSFYLISSGIKGMPVPITQTFPRICKVVGFNILFYFGTGLCCFEANPIYPLVGYGQPWFVIEFICTAGLLLILLWYSGKSVQSVWMTFLGFVLIWGCCFSTASGIFIFNPADYADRYNMFPGLTLVVLLAILLDRLMKKYQIPVQNILLPLLLFSAVNAYFCIKYIPHWKNTRTLFTYSIHAVPEGVFPSDRSCHILFPLLFLEKDTTLCRELSDILFRKGTTEKMLPRDIDNDRTFRLVTASLAGILASSYENKPREALKYYYFMRKLPDFNWQTSLDFLEKFDSFALNIYAILENFGNRKEINDFLEWQAVKSRELNTDEDAYLQGLRLINYGRKKEALKIWKENEKEYPKSFRLHEKIKALEKSI